MIGPRAVPKRRDDFHRGRWIAKKLLMARFPGTGMLDHVITPDERGVPIAHDALLRPRPVSLSITHTAGFAGAAVVDAPGQVGIDAEVMIAEPSAIARDYFTEQEQALATGDPMAATIIWSSKEAIAKALGEGLRLSLQSVRVVAIGEAAADGWREVSVEGGLGVWAWVGGCVVAVAGAERPEWERKLGTGD